MSEYTPITADMRLLLGCFTKLTDFERDKFTQLCDTIDSIHAQLERENESLKAELDRVLGEHGNRDGLLQLPLDADRVPIFIGDVMESDYITRTEVAAVGIKCFFAWSNIDRRWHQYEANQFRHHQPDTWERIIDDAEALAREWFNTDMSENEHAEGLDVLVARCKKLAGES